MPEPEVDASFEALLEHLRTVRGVDFTGYKRASLMRLVRRRMQACHIEDHDAYRDHLEVDPGEFALLFDTLLINVTTFFRDPDAWRALREDLLPGLFALVPDDAPIRVWSAACATGEEAYTLAVVLAEQLGPDEFRRRVKVYATDIDLGALSTARAGVYPRSALAHLDPELVDRYFEPHGSQLAFRADLRPTIVFGRHDLIQDAPISRIDVLTCRNALMYLNSETQARVLDRFSFALRDHGLLMLGKAEMLLTQGQLFRPVDLGHRLFRKTAEPGRRRPGMTGRAVEVGQGDMGLRRVAQAAFTSAPEAQLVLDRDGVLSMVNDAAVRNLGVRREDVGSPIQDLPLSYQPVELRGPVAAVHDGGDAVRLKNVPWRRGDQDVWYDVLVVPLSDDGGEVLGVQIAFLDVTRYQLMARDLEAAHRNLETAYEELQSSNEELETTNEELQSAVEELETTNEELQSTNEELETMNEELQSTNEELQTLNDELRERTGEVNQVNTFLKSILTGLRGGVVVVDRDLVVRVWNDQAEQMWGLRAHEAQGRHFLSLDIGLPVASLRSTLTSILSGEKPQVELTVDATNRFGKPVTCTIGCTRLVSPRGEVNGAIVVLGELAQAS